MSGSTILNVYALRSAVPLPREEARNSTEFGIGRRFGEVCLSLNGLTKTLYFLNYEKNKYFTV